MMNKWEALSSMKEKTEQFLLQWGIKMHLFILNKNQSKLLKKIEEEEKLKNVQNFKLLTNCFHNIQNLNSCLINWLLFIRYYF